MEVAIGVVIGLQVLQFMLAGVVYRRWRGSAGVGFVSDACNHQWRIENKDTIPNAWSQLPDIDGGCATGEPPEWLFRATIATTYICILCGAMRTETVTNHEPKS